MPFRLNFVSTCFATVFFAFALAPAGSHAATAAKASTSADATAALRQKVDATMQAVMSEYAVPGMAVALTVDGRTYFFNYGVASKEQKTAVTQETLFELGSVSKIFTATLASYAEEQGFLSLDDHPSKYLPQLKGSAIDRASLRQLGTYSAAGLPLQVPDNITDSQQMITYFQNWKPSVTPGSVRLYSNASIGLLGHLTGLAMQSNFTDAAQGILFPELGLKHSYITVPDQAMADYAWGYDKNNRAVRVTPGMFDAEAYGVKASASDMLRMVQLNIEPEQLSGPLRYAVVATQVAYEDVAVMVQGLGWEQYRYPVTLTQLLQGNAPAISGQAQPVHAFQPQQAPVGPRLFNKTGSTGGFGSYVLFVPEQKIGIVMLANKNFPIPARVTAAYTVLEQALRLKTALP
ncbi:MULTISPECIES: class C beta-lactamase [unclassified Undibacterium]|uniref:class C beta-lactamase n=1 Tax=unclassified Undibacterium TaxID=2630295 RepID=UPI002AC96698|nr:MULTISPECIES: class C beta-lactamase [unclassified Undibacterium]MEB0141116.1 class C beta-lactamase [Undibacterium sp. CCC2.1]MEB0174133.1 class C beta-lactamase [Undibacterium sp. CCC1.1]MEB0177836.1 class C beta-lactamase [Undibacterium sp. CCC3.4]MEB0217027.1 class C beta-lactamase [Undibacterium sp. 5I2]WPX41986.1 class C beta-lactamase [Undibacterium sp. CCC3.4]